MSHLAILFRVALRNLAQARRRTALLSTAIGLVTMLLVLLLSLSEGIRDNLVTAATTISAGHVNVGGFYKATSGEAAPIVDDVARVREIVERRVPNVDYVTDRHRGWAKLISPTDSVQSGLSGIDVAQEARLLDRIEVVAGDPTRLAEPATMMVYEGQARRLGVDIGDEITIQSETFGGRTNTVDVTVVAVARDVGLLSSFAVYVPKSVIFDLYQLDPNTTGAVFVYLDDIDDADDTRLLLREVLAEEGYQVMEHEPMPFFMKFERVQGEDWTGQKLDVTTWLDEVSFLAWVLTAFDTVTWFLVAILVLIIAVGIMNTMWNAVRERTREVGTMRAIGMQRTSVLALFLLEALLLGLIATSVGAFVGVVVALGVDALDLPVPIDAMRALLMSNTLHLAPSPWDVALAIGSLTLFTGLSALWPALRASLLPPITALGHTT